jgi:ABC-type uncharacterized transport system involved in gliding motility auxiliary subunit
VPSKIIVIADGDIIRNEINKRTGESFAIGFDPLSQYTFANQDLIMNSIAYLVDDNGLITARNKEIKIRPLDKEKIKSRVFWQSVNLVLPLIVLIAFGFARSYWRKRKYAKF